MEAHPAYHGGLVFISSEEDITVYAFNGRLKPVAAGQPLFL